MNPPISIGVIGVGQIGKQHVQNYAKIPGARVVAIADINKDELEKVGGEHNIAQRFTDFRDLLRLGEIDAVDVCLHNNFHAPVTIAALEAGKHVYCEKPMAGSYHDAQAMFDCAHKCDRKLSIQLNTLFQNEIRAAKQLIDHGALGEIYHARSTGYRRRGRPFVDGYGTSNFVQKRSASGGALYDMGVYHISAALYLLGNPTPRRVSGMTYQKTPLHPGRAQSSGYDVEELGLGLARFNDAVTLDIIESWAVHMNEFEGSSVFGSLGGIPAEPFGFFNTVADFEMSATVNLGSAASRWRSVYEMGDAYDSSQHHWIAALAGRVPLIPAAEIALNTMLISEGIYLSTLLNREVSAEEIIESSKSTAAKL